MCLLWGADLRLPPSWRMSTVQVPRKTWLATGACSQFAGGCQPLGLRLPLAFCLSASLGEGHVHNWLALLWYLLNPLALAGHSQRTAPLPHVSEAPGHEGCEWEASLGNQWVTAGFSFRSNSPRALVLAWSHSLPCLLLQPLLCDPLKLVQTL